MTEKESRLDALQKQVETVRSDLFQQRRQSYRYSLFRLAIIGVGFVLSQVVLYFTSMPWMWATLLLTAVLFIWFVRRHQRLDALIRRNVVIQSLKEAFIARMTLDWDNIPAHIDVPVENRLPIEVDLDLVGERSLHQLMNTAVTSDGQARLRAWLNKGEVDLPELGRRQAIVKELIADTAFRDEVIISATLAQSSKRHWTTDQLLDLINSDPPHKPPNSPIIFALFALAALNILLFILSTTGILPPLFQYTFLLYLLIVGPLTYRASAITNRALNTQAGLETLLQTFQVIEDHDYANSPHLAAHLKPITDSSPTHALNQIAQTVSGLMLRQNGIVWMIVNALIPWDLYWASRFDTHRKKLATHLPPWLETYTQTEVLIALANFAWLNPAYTFPTISTDNASLLETTGLGHPLLDHDARVNNDFQIAQIGTVNLITGSNMAGKSTFLRTIGINLVLAYAGTATCAHALTARPLRLFSVIKVTDSVADGFSYFYAEVRRLRALLDALQDSDPTPVLYFVDEIFRGTNNRERLQGSQALIREIATHPAIGIISTHDLELVKLESEIARFRNTHFREEIVDGKMAFDYKLREGPCPTTNALRIMELEGLPVN